MSAKDEILRANEEWPENPFADLLTSEGLRLGGRFEEAAALLEKSELAQDMKWLVQIMNSRAGEVRDLKDKAEPLIEKKDLLREIIVGLVNQTADESGATRKLKSLVDKGRSMGDRILEQTGKGGKQKADN